MSHTLLTSLDKIIKTTKKHFTALEEKGITTAEDLLLYFPREYENRSSITELSDLRADAKNVLLGLFTSVRREKTANGFSLVKANFTEESSNQNIECVWFNARGKEKTLPLHTRVMVVAKAKLGYGKISLQSPDVQIYDGEVSEGLAPIYSEHYFLTNAWFFRKIHEELLPKIRNNTINIPNIVPKEIREKRNLLTRKQAIEIIHYPKDEESLNRARETLAFEELFVLQIVSLQRKARLQEKGEGSITPIELNPEMIKDFFETLPFVPTNAQKISMFEMFKDYEKTVPMQRLLEGDVGSGKTLVAVCAALPLLHAGYQIALMAPTEILASQLHKGVTDFLNEAEDQGFWDKWGDIVPFVEGEGAKRQGEQSLQREKDSLQKHTRLSYNKSLTEKAQILRKNLTPQEKKLWYDFLSSCHYKFLKQRPIDNYIVDFYCPEKKLVVELDGESHFTEDGERSDIKRDLILKSHGLTILRFTNVEIGENFGGVCKVITEKLDEIKSFFFEDENKTPPASLCSASPSTRGTSEQNLLFPENQPFKKVEFLSGSVKGKSREKILEELRHKKIDVLVGTHALLEDWVIFNKLGLVIVDEQHRFGVMQRERMIAKGNPHFLQMSATPIPRSLAIVAFGDQDLSVLNELPPGRKPIETKVITPTGRRTIELFIDAEVEKGRQVFVICPLVEESEHFEDLKSATEEYIRLSEHIFPNRKVNLLHGKMKPKEKDAIMNDFKAKKFDILVATSVVEVGVDVPNATIMMIEGAERFGLSQLHQFRGRVGRGKHSSYCFLFPTKQNQNSRLQAMEKTQNGFELAEIDMHLRGAGEVFGLKQSGVPDLKMATMMDGRRVIQAKESAEEFLATENVADFQALDRAVMVRKKKNISQ